jgi:hypothetical protein
MTELRDQSGDLLTWTPRRVHSVQGGRPLDIREPPHWLAPAAVRRLLEAGYGLIVALQPGDGTRYSMILSPTVGGFVLTTTNSDALGPYDVAWASETSADEAVCLGRDEWTRTLLAWWCEELRSGSGGAP